MTGEGRPPPKGEGKQFPKDKERGKATTRTSCCEPSRRAMRDYVNARDSHYKIPISVPEAQVEMCVGEQVEALVRFSHVRNEEGFGSEVCLRARSVEVLM